MVIFPAVKEPAEYNDNYILFWNWAGLQMNRLTHSIGGPQNGPALSSRVLGLLHLAIHDAYFAIMPPADNSFHTYLDPNASDPAYRLPAHDGLNGLNKERNARQAVSAAALSVLRSLYTTPDPKIATKTTAQLNQFLQTTVDGFGDLDALSDGYRFGAAVGKAILGLLITPGEPGADQGFYRPKPGPYKFRDEPNNPVRIVPVDPNDPNGPKQAAHIYYAPFYGMTAKRFAVQMKVNNAPTEHIIADPPVGFGRADIAEYNDAVLDVRRMGGQAALNDTRRRPSQTEGAYFWAYDGTNLIGTPPRLYNQILRKVAVMRKLEGITAETTNADFARLFAVANAALADAGIFSWKEKYTFEFWRPLSGVREDTGPNRDPFFQSLGSPETNNNNISFKPPFPAYPSGHATFGGAFFQTVRLYYKHRDHLSFADNEPDNISLEFVSDELNGINRDLRQDYDPNQPIENQVGTVRTLVVRQFKSLWDIIFDNAISRAWLGVHWRSDAFAPQDVLIADPTGQSLYTLAPDGTTAYKDTDAIRYQTLQPRSDRPGQLLPVGGVPLGMGIANDIWQSGLKPTPKDMQPSAVNEVSATLMEGPPLKVQNEMANEESETDGMQL